MKGKKGLDYIDWSMSMGIFIIAVIALFIFLKPGARLEYDQETLTTMVEHNFMNRAQWFVHETPLFVRNFQDVAGGAQAFIRVYADGDMRFSAVKPATHARYDPITGVPGSRIEFNCNSSCDGTNFTLIGITRNQNETIDMHMECIPSNNAAACTAVVGATVTRRGLQQDKIDELANPTITNYDTVKRAWTYPLQREFAMYQDGTKIIGGKEQAQQADIFVKEIKTEVISPSGTTRPTVISIRVW